VVLESLSVFWLEVANIPNFFLSRIRQLLFRFFWSGCGVSERVHICKWEDLAKLKSYGGLGFNHMIWFSRALVSNTLWCCLMKDGLWHRVIMDKYISSSSVVSSLRRPSVSSHKVSNTWICLLKYFHVVEHWIAWKPRSSMTI
jgi:hypothetical protein